MPSPQANAHQATIDTTSSQTDSALDAIDEQTIATQIEHVFLAYQQQPSVVDRDSAKRCLSANLSTQLALTQWQQALANCNANDIVQNTAKKLENYLLILNEAEIEQRQTLQYYNDDYIKQKIATYHDLLSQVALPDLTFKLTVKDIDTLFTSHLDQLKNDATPLDGLLELAQTTQTILIQRETDLQHKMAAIDAVRENATVVLSIENFLSTEDQDIKSSLQPQLSKLHEAKFQEIETIRLSLEVEYDDIIEKRIILSIEHDSLRIREMLEIVLEDAGSQSKLETLIDQTTLTIKKNQKEISQLQTNVTTSSITQQKLITTLQTDKTTLADLQQKAATEKNSIARLENTLAALSEERIQHARTKWDHLNQELEKFKRRWFKTPEAHWDLYDLAMNLESMLIQTDTPPRPANKPSQKELEEKIGMLNKIISPKEEEIQNLQQLLDAKRSQLDSYNNNIEELNKKIAFVQTLIDATPQLQTNLYNEQESNSLQLDTLRSYLDKLTTAFTLHELSTQFSLATKQVQHAKHLEKHMHNQSLDSFSTIIALYNQATDLLNKQEFNHIAQLFTLIMNRIKDLHDNDNFKMIVLQVVTDKRQTLAQYQMIIVNIATAIKEIADQAAKRLADVLKSQLQKSQDKLAEIASSVNNLETKKTIAKLVQRMWYQQDVLNNLFTTLSNTLTNSQEKAKQLQSNLEKYKQDTSVLIDKNALTEQLNLNELHASAVNNSAQYQDIANKLATTSSSTRDNLTVLAELSKIVSCYSAMLDNYKQFRDERYWFKDLFFSSDKKKRHAYIDKLQAALHEYEYLNLSHTKLATLVNEGLTQFAPGLWSYVKDPQKNLKGILSALNTSLNTIELKATEVYQNQNIAREELASASPRPVGRQ